jgi:CRISPR-associated protein Csm3
MAKLLGNIILEGKIIAKTGLHIGGSTETLQIGGVDKPVLRDPHTQYPYIPGSSLKGKLRMLVEFKEGLVTNGDVVSDPDKIPAQIFGTSADKSNKNGPTRLTVRDACPDEETIKMWADLKTDLLYTEYKGENNLDRITSKANPRFFERVVPNSKFNCQFVYSIYDGINNVNDISNIEHLFEGLILLEQSSLGGHGSRGYGRIEFEFKDVQIFTLDDYRNGQAKTASDDQLHRLNKEYVDRQMKKIREKFSGGIN